MNITPLRLPRYLLAAVALFGTSFTSRAQAPADEAWYCLGGIDVPVRVVGSDVVCASEDGKNCMWGRCQGSDFGNRPLPFSVGNAVRPLVCGFGHKAIFGSTVYDDPDHWCARACKALHCAAGRGSPPAVVSQPRTATQPGQSAQPSVQPAQSVRLSTAPLRGRMLPVRAGSFTLGSDERWDDEKPPHEIPLETFQMDETEVTVAAFARWCGRSAKCNQYKTAWLGPQAPPDQVAAATARCNYGKPDRAEHPVNCVDWASASAYCRAQGKDLPWEPEWEYAARGKDGRKYPWGNDRPSGARLNGCGPECPNRTQIRTQTDEVDRLQDNDGWPSTAPVGQFPDGRSPFGILDMAGNVSEWTLNPYCPYDGTLACKPSGMGMRVVRGGSWNVELGDFARAAYRDFLPPDQRSDRVGFRCIKVENTAARPAFVPGRTRLGPKGSRWN